MKMIGQWKVKEGVKAMVELVMHDRAAGERGEMARPVIRHRLFLGNPGTVSAVVAHCLLRRFVC